MPIPLIAATAPKGVQAVAGAVEGIAKAIGSIAGIHFGSSPRIYGKLYGTIAEIREGVEGKTANLNGRTYNDVETVELLDTGRRTDAGDQGIWDNLLPTWNPTPAARAAILKADPSHGDRFGVPDLPSVTREAPALSAGPGAVDPVASGRSGGPISLPAGTSWIWLLVAAVVLYLVLRK